MVSMQLASVVEFGCRLECSVEINMVLKTKREGEWEWEWWCCMMICQAWWVEFREFHD